jgi:hypothetical protein
MRSDRFRLMVAGAGLALLASCAPAPIGTEVPVTAPPAAPITPTMQPEAPAGMLSMEEARDAAVAALASRFGLPAPSQWDVQAESDGGALFTAEGWVARVEGPSAGQEASGPAVHLSVGHAPSGLAWVGSVDPDGTVEEESLVAPASVTSAEQARDLAVAFVAQERALEPPGTWVDSPLASSSPAIVAITYTSGPWVAQVSHEAAAPLIPTFSVIVDHMGAGLRWMGEVDQRGALTGAFVGASGGVPQAETVDGWIGTIVSSSPGAQFDDYFEVPGQSVSHYGIDGAEDALRARLIEVRDTGTYVRIWGTLERGVPDAYGVQIVVTRLEPALP